MHYQYSTLSDDFETLKKVPPVKGVPYWRKGNLVVPAKNISKGANLSLEQRQETQEMLMESFACYLNEHPEHEKPWR